MVRTVFIYGGWVPARLPFRTMKK